MRSRCYDRMWTALVALLPWLVQPGLVQPDTKVDLTLSPWHYLHRALAAWNPDGGLGEVQNQAYGYLFPMGPVFGVGQSLGLPAWAVQRLWWTILLVVAFLGCRRLIRAWGVAGPTASTIAAFAYALSPRVLTLLSDHSVEAWPGAVAPWLLLVATGLTADDLDRRTRWTLVARVGLLTAALGGVNATASAAALLPAFLLLVVHPLGRRRVPWFALAVLAGALWWVLPLLVLGRYAYPFLDYIETASITTAVTSVPNTLRGADNWIAYILDAQSHPVWQGGWVVAQSLSAIVLTCVVAAIGAIGVIRLEGVVRRFALVSVLLGTLAMAIGHPGQAGAPFAGFVQQLLDGPLVVLRNVHKLDLLIRLPFALGLAAVLTALAHQHGRSLLRRRVHAGIAAVLVACSMVPLWQGRVGSDASYAQVPESVTDAAAQLDRLNQSGGATLLLPSSRTASYTWGRSTDEPLSALAQTPVVVRASAPLGNPVATRLLDAVDTLAGSGQSQPALAPTLARMGVRVVLVRRDLAENAGAGSWRQVERTLAASPGFSPVPGADAHRSLWTVTAAAPARVPEPIVMSGGAEALPAALATGAVPIGAATELASDSRRATQLVTDSLVWRAYVNGQPAQRAYGPTLTADDPAPQRAGSKDLPPVLGPKVRPHRQLIGLDRLEVSSSAADPFAKAYVSVAHSQFAAIDGDTSTAWLTGRNEAVASINLTLSAPTTGGELVLSPATGRGVDRPARIEVSGGGYAAFAVVAGPGPVRIEVPAGLSSLTVTLRASDGAVDPVMGLAEMSMAGTRWGSIITVPTVVDLRDQALLLGSDATAAAVPARAGEDGAGLARRVTFARPAGAPVRVWFSGDTAHVANTCGAAGSLMVADQRIPLRFEGPTKDGLRSAVVCTPARFGAGTVDLRVVPSAGARVQHLLIGQPFTATGPTTVFATTHGANDGWIASQSGKQLMPVTLDGWRQGYRGAAGGDVRERFAPTTVHRIGLGVGALSVLLLALLTWRTRRVRTVRAPLTPTPAAGELASTVLGVLVPAAVGFLTTGPAGLVLGVLSAVVPRRFRPACAGAALILAGLALALGGVVDERAWGAITGQVLGTFTLTLLAVESMWLMPASTPSEPSSAARSGWWRRTQPSP